MSEGDSEAALHEWDRARQRIEGGVDRPWVYTVVDCGPRDEDAVVIVSGVAVPWVDWADVLAVLSRRQRVVLVEREGMEGPWPLAHAADAAASGASTAPPSMSPRPCSFERPALIDEAGALAELLETLGVRQVIVMAHSLGGFIGEAFARLFPERCTRLVLVDGSCEQPSGGAVEPAWGESIVTRVAPRFLSGQRLRHFYARALWWPRRAGLRTIDPEIEGPYVRAFFADECFIRTLWAEWEVYHRWAQELCRLVDEHPLCAELRVLVASRHRITPDPWVSAQRKRFQAYHAQIRAQAYEAHIRVEEGREARGVQNSFEVVSASHLVMREYPDLVASLAATQ